MGDRLLTEKQRTAILDQQLFELARRGGRLQARTPTSAVVETGKPVNHVLHLLVSVFMCGLWLPVWLIAAAFGGTWTRTVTVDEYGEVRDSRDDAIAKSRRTLLWLIPALLLLFVVAFVWRWG